MNPLDVGWTLGGAGQSAALVFPDGRTWTYEDLRAAVLERADELMPHCAVVCREAPDELLVDTLAAWHAGAVAVSGTVSLSGTAVIDRSRQLDNRAALLMFTSGSTGTPKGVLLSGTGLRANVEAIVGYLPVSAVPDTAVVLPLRYSYALIGQALTTLHAGGCLHLLQGLPFPAQQLEAIGRIGRPVGLSSVPTSLRRLAETWLDRPAPVAFGYLASAGGSLVSSTLGLVRRAFPGVRFFNQYGLTEASPRVTALSDADPAFAFGSVGRALPGLQVFAVGLNSGERLPTGASGELVVRGPSVMLGYLDDPDGTARALGSDGTLRTGDLGHIDHDGLVFLEGRRDSIVKVAGERVSLTEIGEILGAEVVAVPDDVLGNRLIAFVEDDGATARTLSRTLPAQKRPARVISLEVLPRTANGKADLVALRALARKQ